MRKLVIRFLFFIFIVSSIGGVASAVAVSNEKLNIITIDDMECMALEDIVIKTPDIRWLTRATNTISWSIEANSAMKADKSFTLEADEVVSINCSYSPNSACVDFGLIAPDGRFYFIPCDSGSINQAIQVSDRGQYYLAIYNNSSHKVSVSGFVSY